MHKLPSNPSIDIHYLTGWIPETVNFEDLSNKESLWVRLVQNFRDQNIIICLQENIVEYEKASSNKGQGGIHQEIKRFYTVLDLIETDEHKIIQCKSPYKGDKQLLDFIEESYKLPQHFQVRFRVTNDYLLE